MDQLAIALDVETTGLIEPQVIQLAQTDPFAWNFHLGVDTHTCRYKPTKPIEPGAMAVHRIIAEDLAQEPDWPGWQAPPQVAYLIGHFIDSDWEALGKPDMRRICTGALAKRLWPDLGSYKLSALIFHLYEAGEARKMTELAHDARTDVHLSLLLLDHLLWDIPQVQSLEGLWLFCEDARIPLRIGFSKFGPKNGQPGTLYTEIPDGMLKWIIDPIRVAEMDRYEVIATRRELQRRTDAGIRVG